MSKSARKPSTPTRPTATPSRANARATAKPAHPWIIDGVNYGPAIAAVGDLAAWAFDLAERDVDGWPEGARRVRSARRFVLSRLQGKRPRSAPFEDVLFTAGLLARIFEGDLSLGMSDMVAILDQLGLPTEVVPLMPRVQPSQRVPLRPDISPIRPRPVGVVRTVDPCDECGCFPRYRNAA